MKHNDLIEVAKASQIATIETLIIMLEALQLKTGTDYTTAIALRNAQIAKIQAL